MTEHDKAMLRAQTEAGYFPLRDYIEMVGGAAPPTHYKIEGNSVVDGDGRGHADIIRRLRERAGFAREEKTATAICDARHFEDAANAITAALERAEKAEEALDEIGCGFYSAKDSPWRLDRVVRIARAARAGEPWHEIAEAVVTDEERKKAAPDYVEAMRQRDEALAKLDKARKALKPFSDRVYYDNGSVSVSDQYLLTIDNFIEAFFAFKAITDCKPKDAANG